LRLLRVTRDGDLIERARDDARAWVEQDPELTAWPPLQRAIGDLLAGEREEFLDRA
jgi:ATP-dependent DNA helicase RecG